MSLYLLPRGEFEPAVGCRMKARAPGWLRLVVCWDSMYDLKPAFARVDISLRVSTQHFRSFDEDGTEERRHRKVR
jgi:hypothetical protein